MKSTRIRLGISSCLLGQSVRYDGGHKHNEYITATLGSCFEFVPFCPEVAVGLGVPRPPIQLVRQARGVRALGVTNAALDVTDQLVAYAERVAPALTAVSGYILKKSSPSCGMERVTVYRAKGAPLVNGVGVYARVLMERRPEMPFEDEGRLMDPVLRENFIERVFVYHRWQQLMRDALTPELLVEFHTRHKLIVLAHDERAYRALGRDVAAAGHGKIAERGAHYIRQLMQSLKKPATRARHANVLQHAFGFLKRNLDRGDKSEMLGLIERYRRGQVPLIVPITLMRHYLRRSPQPYLEQQYYLAQHPDELLLRNLV